jgi:hypothetical protein
MPFWKDIFTAPSQWWRQYRRKLSRRPNVLRKWYKWQSVSRSCFKIFYVPSSATEEQVLQIADGCDESLQRIRTLLALGPLKRPVTIYLYPDMHSFKRCEQIQGWPFPAIARGSSISLPYSPWRQIAKTMAHELTHVLCYQIINKRSNLLLNEGLATYVDGKLYPLETLPPMPCLDAPLHGLANYRAYWGYVKGYETCHDTYAHVRSLALYLVHRGGMNRFIGAIRASAHKNTEKWDKRFAAAIRKIYGLELDELEQQWRQDSAITCEGTMICWDWVLPTARTIIHDAQERARQRYSNTIEAEHLLWAILRNPQYVATRLASQVASTKEMLHCIENLTSNDSAKSTEPLLWATTTRQCIALAIIEVRNLNCNYIGTEHLLLGILSQQKNLGCQLCSDFGVELEGLRSATRAYYRTTAQLE